MSSGFQKSLVVATAVLMALCAVAIIPTDESEAANPNKGTWTYSVYAGQSFSIQLTKDYGGIESLSGAPSWVSRGSTSTLTGTAPDSVGESFTFTITMGANQDYSPTVIYSDITVVINVISAPQVDLNNPGLKVTPDANAQGQTYTVAENQAVWIYEGSYGFKFSGMWWTETLAVSVNGGDFGLVNVGDHWAGVLPAGSHTFTASTSKGSFNFTIRVTEVSHTISFNANGGSTPNSYTPCGWGDSIKLPVATRDNYSFAGWYDGNTFVGFAGQEVTFYEDKTLTAKWSTAVNANNMTVVTGDAVSFTPTAASDATIAVDVDWLSVTGNLVSGIAPSPGTYDVTLTVTGSNAEPTTVVITITVLSELAPTNAPSNGLIIYVSG